MLDELRHFLLILEQGTFTRAARRAHLSQPALTASVRRLEGALGARLLHRGRRGATPTSAGEALRPRALAVLAAVADARRAVAEVSGAQAGEVRVGAGATVCTYLLPPALAEFRRRHPAVRLLVREATARDVLDAVAAGEVDLAVVPSADGEPWLDDELVLVASAPMARALRPRGGRGGVDLRGAPFIALPPGATSRELLERHLSGARVVMELGGIAAIKANVRAGIGLALVSRAAIVHDLAHRRLEVVPHPATPIRRALRIVHRGLDRMPPAAAALREVLLRQAAEERGVRRARRTEKAVAR